MLVPETLLPLLVVAAIAAPLAAFVWLGSVQFLVGVPSEALAHRSVGAALLVVLGSTAMLALAWFSSGQAALDIPLGTWFRVGTYEFPLGARIDQVSAPISVAVAVVSVLVGRFAIHYMHREKGYARFFTLFALATAGLEIVVLASTFDQLFVGWELLGLSSILLVMFFQERPGPTSAGVRVLVTYRLCDVGLLFGAVVLLLFFHPRKSAIKDV